jgi:hypothetical protein
MNSRRCISGPLAGEPIAARAALEPLGRPLSRLVHGPGRPGQALSTFMPVLTRTHRSTEPSRRDSNVGTARP